MSNCIVCGGFLNSSDFGNYCSKNCRDSDIGILGKLQTCECCGNQFKSLSRSSLCINCIKQSVTELEMPLRLQNSSFSSFKYSIFEDNIQRILEASNNGDKRNCTHATYVISETIDASMIPALGEILEKSNDKTKVWLIEIMARLKDKRAIAYLQRCLSKSQEYEVHVKAIEAIKLLKECC